MNDGKLKYEISMDYNASGGDKAKRHIESVKSGYLAFNQLLRGDVVGSIQSANRALGGFSYSLSRTLGLMAKIAGPLFAGFQTGKLLDSAFGISDKISASIVPAIKFNSELEKSLAQLRDLNKTKLDAITKEFSAFGETLKKAGDHAMALLELTNKTNLNKAPTEEAQYSAGQTSKIDIIKQLDQNRQDTANHMKEVEKEYMRRLDTANAWGERQSDVFKSSKPDGIVARHYREEKENRINSAKDLVPQILQLSNDLKLLDAQIEAAGSEISKASREMTQKSEQKEAAAFLGKAREEDQARRSRLVIESQRRYHEKYDPLSDEDKLKVTERNIGNWKKNLAGASSEKERLDFTEKLDAQLKERDQLKKRISDTSISRAEKIKAAQENISKASERSVGSSDLAGYFQRVSDVRAGRTPRDDAARQTADNTRIIAENTAFLKKSGALKI